TRIFVHDAQQRQLAERSKQALEATGIQPIATQITAAEAFYPAEDYHQDYYLKNPRRYRFYRYTCGRDQRLKQVWGSSAPHRESSDASSSLP
ncbi:MAG: peptide-methionine (S)-S-oxide reductase, partial [Thermosynechococcaceae cyanobacterium]